MEEYEEEVFEEGIDLEEIAKKYEERGFFRRLGDMFRGLGKPHETREYKLARIELQRLAAPLVAIVVPILFGVVLCVVTMISGQKKNTITVDIAQIEDNTDELVEEEEIPPDDIEPPPMEDVEITVDTPTPGPVSTVTPAPTPPSQQVTVKPATMDTVMNVKSPVTMRQMTGSRNPGSIGSMTRGGAGYGDAITEATVMKVLWWLKAHQNTDGSWGGGGNAVANTGFAILTYLAHGEFPGSPSPYRRDFGPVVQQAIDYLITHIRVGKDGIPHFQPTDGNEYSFLIATYALCEAYGMTKNPNCKEAALQCLNRIVQNQSSTGGWDYKVNKNSTRDDLSFAGWAIQALKAGKMAGLHPQGLQAAINKAINCLKKRSYSKSGGFTYTPTQKNNGGATGLAGVGTLAMQLLGRGGESEALNALEVMRDWKPTFSPDEMSAKKPGSNPQYYCYYATQCKYQAGMKAGATKNDEVTWQQWNVAMKKTYPSLIKEANAQGPLPKVKDYTGKEHKQGYFENLDAHSTRPYMDSCLAALQLMVYYRYLPTTSVEAGKDEAVEDAAKAMDKSKDVAVTVDI
jgi:hypothetical protein